MTAAGQPLHGVRILELAQNLAGPWCAQILSDLGASVIKVERPDGGDAAREWGPPFVNGAGSIFAASNRGKRSIALDLSEPANAGVLERLVRNSDVLIEAFRPGAFDALGFGWDVVQRWNPRLIYCSVTAYGETGPLRHLPGYDPLMQAHGGIMSVTGHAVNGPARAGISIIDMGAGMWLTIGVLSALRERDLTGTGTRLSVALFETALAWNAYHLLGHAADGTVPRPMGTELPMIAPYGAFPTSDGQLMIAAGNDNLFRRLCAELQLDAGADTRFTTNPSRVANRAAVNEAIAAATARLTSAQLLARLQGAGVPCAPILDIAGVAADPQTEASGMLGAAPSVGLPLRFAGLRPPAGGRVPEPGEHTAEILQELGLSEPGGGNRR
jgi:crotonobetainyl-CoA:carnitine CoA-transferase CaiB-like acyl-CoA transferase